MKIECRSKALRVRKINFPCLLLGSGGRKYSGLTNAEICKTNRQSMGESEKVKEQIRKLKWQENLKKNQQNTRNILRINTYAKIIQG